MPDDAQLTALVVAFEAMCYLLSAHTSRAMAILDLERLLPAYASLEALCEQYACDALQTLSEEAVLSWHHKLLYSWCASLPLIDHHTIEAAYVRAAHPEVWAELQLAQRCGPQLQGALLGTVAYQELLFPGGSMDAVQPMYDSSALATFYNVCVVAAAEAILALLPRWRRINALEVGAGTGATASSVLPAVQLSCERYVFTDVSGIFLRQARLRFGDMLFLEYALLNIDADPRLQGFAPHQCDVIISTNCLHATPCMHNSLRNCAQLLREGGVLVVNEGLRTSATIQISFGMTDGWWLFAEGRDSERSGQGSPLVNWRQWQSLLADSGFGQSYCMQGRNSLFQSQAVVVAQAPSSPGPGISVPLENGAHFFLGGLGGLGLLTARLIVEAGGQQLVLSSRSDRMVAGSESDWAWLMTCGISVRRVRCDASDVSGVHAALMALYSEAMQLVGIFHAAHALVDATLANQNALNFRTSFGPKVHGAEAAHAAVQGAPLRHFNLFSSIAGLMGSAGQAPHSAASAWLSAMASWRQGVGMRCQSVNWGAVAEIGYAARYGADRCAEASGLGAISRTMTVTALRSTLLPACRSFVVLPADWPRLLAYRGEVRGYLMPYAHLRGNPRSQASTSTNELPAASSVMTLEDVLAVAGNLAGGLLDSDAPLMEAGIDSLGATELRNQLQHMVGPGLPIPGTLTLDYPTPRQIAGFLNPLSPACGWSLCASVLPPLELHPALVRGTAAALPGGAQSLGELWLQGVS
jgi:SAM-dependent methyltransferase